MRTRLLCASLVATLAGDVAAHAHHSLAGMYDQGRRVTVDGIVAEFHYVNPHPFLLVDSSDAGGGNRRWKMELDNRGELAEIGVRNDTLKAGDRVLISGSPGRTDPLLMYVWRLDRPADGFQYEQIGTSPRIRWSRP